MMTTEEMHIFVRRIAGLAKTPDKKQLNFNGIVEAAQMFYPNAIREGLKELVDACDKANTELYVKNRPMHQVLVAEYGWMLKESCDE